MENQVQSALEALIPPHLNADVYKKNTSVPSTMNNLDYVKIHFDGKLLIGCSELSGRYWNGGARLLNSLNEAQNIKATENFIYLRTGTPDGCFVQSSEKVLLCEDDGSISIWSKSESSWSNWEESITVSEHDDTILALDFLNPEYITASADGNIKVWDVNELVCTNNYSHAHSNMVSGLAVRPNSQQFASCSQDRHVSLWDRSQNHSINDIANIDCGVRCVSWLDENVLLFGDEAGVLRLADIRNQQIEELETFYAPVHKILVQAESRNVAICCDNKIVSIYNLNENKLRALYKDGEKHTNYVRGMAWHHEDRNNLVTVSWDGTVQTHNIP